MEDADQGRGERPITNPTLTQLEISRANAKRQITRLVYRVDASIKKSENYEEIQEVLVTLLGLATEAHPDYVSSLDVDSGNQETSWLMYVEATAEKCRAETEAYFKLHLPPPTEESVHSEDSNPVVNSKIAQWKTEQTLHQMTEATDARIGPKAASFTNYKTTCPTNSRHSDQAFRACEGNKFDRYSG